MVLPDPEAPIRATISPRRMESETFSRTSVVAMKVLETVITASPGSIPRAIRMKRSASVPLFTPMQ